MSSLVTGTVQIVRKSSFYILFDFLLAFSGSCLINRSYGSQSATATDMIVSSV